VLLHAHVAEQLEAPLVHVIAEAVAAEAAVRVVISTGASV
jgi:hypothetical protein